MSDLLSGMLLKMLGSGAVFREHQRESVLALTQSGARVLLVQRTGWGKSLVYWMATKVWRDRGAGPTLLISPLLSLMRDQGRAARAIGLNTRTIASDNQKDWSDVEQELTENKVDVLMVSPERLQNDRFRSVVMENMRGRVGLLVIDEAHCISEWGHDFRPDYQRIVDLLRLLPTQMPVLATTATANDRVVADVAAQIGAKASVIRGSLARPSLRLAALRIASYPHRLAWMAHWIPKLPHSGIVYCLTVRDAQTVADWLTSRGISSAAYHGDLEADRRSELESALRENQLKALVATVALGMGFDKPDMGFVIHFQAPASIVAYYQQVGRAGRAVDRAYGILLSGDEDALIHDFFARTALPSPGSMSEVLQAVDQSEGLTIREMTLKVNLPFGTLDRAVRVLEAQRMLARQDRTWLRTLTPWREDAYRAHVEGINASRKHDLLQMQTYLAHRGCLMRFLTAALDDPEPRDCGQCVNCKGSAMSDEVPGEWLAVAMSFLGDQTLEIPARSRWPMKLPGHKSTVIEQEHRHETGRCLCLYGQGAWGLAVKRGKYEVGQFDDSLVRAAADLVKRRWNPEPFPQWVTCVPSLRHPKLVPELARRVAELLGLAFEPALACHSLEPEQKTQQNSAFQVTNALRSLRAAARMRPGPVLLMDDVVDSGWTLAVASSLLRQAGAGVVYPLALARATGRGDNG